MLAESDTLQFAPGVVLREGELTDQVRGSAWPLNGSGAIVLSLTGAPLGLIVREIASAFALPAETARRDVFRFVWHLNALALLNIEPKGPRVRRAATWLRLAVRLAPAGSLPAVAVRRRALDTQTLPRAVGSTLVAVSPRAALLATVATVAFLQVAVVAGTGAHVAPLALGLATGLGLGLHEAGHAALLRGIPSALVFRGRRTYVLHAAVGRARRSAVAVAGPLSVSALGVALVLCGSALVVPSLAVAGCPLAAHAIALTVVGGDGRVACEF